MKRAEIAAAYLDACREELDAPKPGNVHRFAGGHGMSVADFLAAAEVSSAPLTEPGASAGGRILGAVAVSRAAVGQNANLGIVLLCAPLAMAAEGRALAAVLNGLDRADARDAFAAIALANPGGLGEITDHDVRAPPGCTLLEAMAAAQNRDRIAYNYTHDFSDVFDQGFLVLAAAKKAAKPPWWPATAIHLAFLATIPDTHIDRKHGPAPAEAVRAEAQAIRAEAEAEADPLPRLLAFDAALKARGLNPGTSADLTVATLFASRLDKLLR